MNPAHIWTKVDKRLESHMRHLRNELVGEAIVFVNGSLDLLHEGHCYLLDYAAHHRHFTRANLNNYLVVGVNSDRSVRALKGPNRPLLGQRQRAAVLAAIKGVREVIIFDDETPAKLIEIVQPSVLVKTTKDFARYTGAISNVPGADFVTANGGKVVAIPPMPNISTTRIIKRMRSKLVTF